MKLNEINIRDPFVVYENGTYYLYGTRAKDFGCHVGGVDVYRSKDLESWSEPIECFNSEQFGLNRKVNWAPEVHRYKGAYYMFITLTQENGLRGTYSLRADSPLGPFVPHSAGALTPSEWECLDGTLYVDDAGAPYLVFCHEHTQIKDGTVCVACFGDIANAERAKAIVQSIAHDPEVGDMFVGVVVRILSTLGAFVEFAPGKDGMIHISKLSEERVNKVEDVLNIGDKVKVKIVKISEKGIDLKLLEKMD